MQSVPPQQAIGTTVGGRYLIEEAIGRGGMASVFRALDTTKGVYVALKLLRPRDKFESLERSRDLFEREFHTLSQLAHPRIVAAIDYGLADTLPYYTMELLDGGDLLERSPLPWREACAVARGVCSALALLHSRRLVYRDLSPRNVRCTSDGKAKLIDFGAMAPMGPAQLTVCTPAVASPEVVYRQLLDARSDLYALGATLYGTLVGRSPYPARTFSQLVELWQRPLPAPSQLVPDIPPALDALVLDLLQLDPQLRPASAAEVSQRLSAIAGLDNDEQLLISQAYLSTPTLVGRARELERFEGMVKRLTQRARGAAMLVRGDSGMGRSRLLDACILSGKLAGLSVVRTSPASAPSGPFGAAQAIVSQLIELLPEQTLQAARAHAPVLRALVPALHARLSGQSQRPAPEDLEAQSQLALRELLLTIAAQRALLVVVDDIERLDSESRALIALLAHQSRRHPLLVLCATDSEPTKDDAQRVLAEACSEITLRPLDVAETQALLASIFGDVPQLSVLVRRMHALSGGNPQSLMRLAQHLLDRHVVRYEDGAWVLPGRINDGDLPASMAQAFTATVAGLSDGSRTLGQAFALSPEERFSLDECVALSADSDLGATFRGVDELVAAGIVVASAEGYALATRAWIAPLSEEVDPELHVRLAEVFERRGDGLRAARHLFRVGREAQGLDVLIAFSERSHAQTRTNTEAYVRFLSTLPADWLPIFKTGIGLANKHRRPKLDLYRLRMRLAGIFTQNDTCADGELVALAQDLAYDVGLDLYAGLDPALPAGVRLQQALGAAAQRHARTPEAERGHDPKTAIAPFVRTVILIIGNLSRTLDVRDAKATPSLAPLAPLAPAVAVTEQLALGFDARLGGRAEEACRIYRGVLALLSDGDAGLEQAFADSMRSALSGITGFLEAVLGLPSAEHWARVVEKLPLHDGSTSRATYACRSGSRSPSSAILAPLSSKRMS